MPFGLKNAPVSCISAFNGDLPPWTKNGICSPYLDHKIVYSKDFDSGLDHNHQVLLLKEHTASSIFGLRLLKLEPSGWALRVSACVGAWVGLFTLL